MSPKFKTVGALIDALAQFPRDMLVIVPKAMDDYDGSWGHPHVTQTRVSEYQEGCFSEDAPNAKFHENVRHALLLGHEPDSSVSWNIFDEDNAARIRGLARKAHAEAVSK